jgi:GET complex subunit GET2
MADAAPDTPVVSSSPSLPTSSPPSSAAEQARIRKERREAKIRAGGSARLNKITGLGGGVPKGSPLVHTILS